MTTNTQPIQDFITALQFNEWKSGIIDKAKFLLPNIISDFKKKELSLHRAQEITTRLFTDLQSTDEETFDESLTLIRSLIAEFSFQRENFYLISQSDFIEKKKDELQINYLEKSIDLNCDAWAQLLSELHPMMLEFADRAFKANMTQFYITDERFSERRYKYNKFSFFNSAFNWEDFRHSYSTSEEYCLKIMPQLLEASEFSEEKVLSFLESVLQWHLFNLLQQEFINNLNELIGNNNVEKVANPVADFNINFLPTTQFELGLDGEEVRDFLKNLFNLISLTETTPTGELWGENMVRLYNENPSKNILLHNHFNISVSKAKRHQWYSRRKLKVKYVK